MVAQRPRVAGVFELSSTKSSIAAVKPVYLLVRSVSSSVANIYFLAFSRGRHSAH